MDPVIYYFGGFVVAVLVIIVVTQVVWQRTIDAMPNPPHWVEAARYVWSDVYGLPWSTLPRIIWVKGDYFVCNGTKVAGNSDMMAVTCAVPTPTTPISRTALAHELRHRARVALGREADGEHKAVDWRPEGIVAAAIQGLKDRGW